MYYYYYCIVPPPNVSLSSVSAAIGGPANFTCNVTVSDFVSDSDLTELSVNDSSRMVTLSGGTFGSTVGANTRTQSFTYFIDSVTTGGVYTCTANVSHTDPNILTSDAGNGTGTLYVSSKLIVSFIY